MVLVLNSKVFFGWRLIVVFFVLLEGLIDRFVAVENGLNMVRLLCIVLTWQNYIFCHG